MNPLNTPYTPFTPITPVSQSQLIQLQAVQSSREYGIPFQNVRPQMVQAIVSPPSGRVRPYGEFIGRPQIDPRIRYVSNQLPQPSPMILDSPDPKRRRFNGNGMVTSNGVVEDPSRMQPTPRSARFSQHDPRRVFMPPPSRVANQYVSPIPVPHAVTPFQLQPARPPHRVHPGRDPSLTLPPLQTPALSPPRSSHAGDGTLPSNDTKTMNPTARPSESSLGAMIQSISLAHKINLLAQISPSLSVQERHTDTLSSQPRGFIVAVEGLDQHTVIDMTRSLLSHLQSQNASQGIVNVPQFSVRIFNGPNRFLERGDGEMTFEQFFEDVLDWHKVSKEMVDFVRGSRSRQNSQASVASTASKLDVRDRISTTIQEEADDEAPSTGTTPAAVVFTDNASQAGPLSAASDCLSPKTLTQAASLTLASPEPGQLHQRHSTVSEGPSRTQPPLPSARTAQSAIPIAIIPGYQLTTADFAATALPITDSYSPLNHWQWLASLWRGCVGPDLTVAIRNSNPDLLVSPMDEDDKAQPQGSCLDHNTGATQLDSSGKRSTDKDGNASTSGVVSASSHEDRNPKPASPPSEVHVRVHLNNSRTSQDAHQQPAHIIIDLPDVSTTTNKISGTTSRNPSISNNPAAGGGAAGSESGNAIPVALSATGSSNSGHYKNEQQHHWSRDEAWLRATRRVGFEVAEFLRK